MALQEEMIGLLFGLTYWEVGVTPGLPLPSPLALKHAYD